MREIKFEYLIKTGKGIVKEVFTLEDIENGKALHLGHLSLPREIIARRQYTGLLDKNGVEIYEGDLIQDGHHGDCGEVKFKEGKFIVEYQDEICDLYDWTCEPIIGNIYENPELLEQ